MTDFAIRNTDTQTISGNQNSRSHSFREYMKNSLVTLARIRYQFERDWSDEEDGRISR
ncbi:MAG: hypothetical protein ACI4EB_02230 [Bilifractor sp.]